jgi:predicted TIM-barrel fold metal-dependent hydrolase
MTQRTFIDCFATVGKRGPKDPEARYETADLVAEMEWCGIHGALVAHAASREYDPMYGNRMLSREIRDQKRLYGVWAVMPHHTREMAPPDELVQELRDNGIRAVKMYPRTHRYPFNVDVCGELLRALQRNEIPLLLEGGHLYGPDIFEPSNQVLVADLDVMLGRFPALNVILQGARWDATRHLYWLMTKHRNLHLELSAHQGNRAVEHFVEWFGVDRILFGTGALEKSPGAAKSFVDYSTISEEQKQRIAGGNIARLLKLDRLPPPYRAGAGGGDSIVRRVRQGKPLDDVLVIDSHAHINHEKGAGTGFIHCPDSDGASMKERAKLMGIDAMCISSFLAIWTDSDPGNEITHRAMKQYPGFYHGYASLSPQYVKDWPRELRKVHKTWRMGGMKPYYPRTFIPYNDPVWFPWYEYGNRMHAYCLIHPSDDVVREMNDLAPRFPNIWFIMAHTGGSFTDARKGIDIALKNPNVSLEITLTAVTYRVIEFMVEHVGADRVLFGSDQPMRDPIPQFGWMAYSHCSVEEKKKMFGLNMRRILRRVRW